MYYDRTQTLQGDTMSTTLLDVRDAQRKTWNRFSAGWKKWDGFVMPWLAPVGEKILEMAKLKDGDKILDIATGTGEPGLTAAKRLPKGSVLGVDVAEEMVTIAGQKAAAAGLKNFKAEAFDGMTLPGSGYDAVTARFYLMFVPDVVGALKEVRRVLKPGGTFSTSVWLTGPENAWAAAPGKIVGELMKTPPPPPDGVHIFRCAAPDYMRNAFTQAGFTDIKEERVPGTLLFRDVEHYWEYLNDVVAPVVMALSNAAPETREQVHQAVVKAMEPFKTAHGLAIPWAAKVVTARA